MNASDSCFPLSTRLLCLWHANKAVLAHCRPAFGFERHQQTNSTWDEFNGYWHSLISSSSEEIYEKRLAEFESKYISIYTQEVGYIKTYWLDPHKERIVKAWVDKHLHFGNVVTSRVEGIHALIKAYLKSSKFDLFDAWYNIKHAITNQLRELQQLRAT
jgi:hypothetical protein